MRLGVVGSILDFLLYIFFILLIGRLILDWVQVFAREWRPRGVVLVLAEVIYTATDPPLRLLRRLIPPLTLGQIRLDLAFIVLFLLVTIALRIVESI